MNNRKILAGGGEIANHLYGDTSKKRVVYRLAETCDLPTFKIGGTLCARPEKLDAWLAEQEAASELQAA